MYQVDSKNKSSLQIVYTSFLVGVLICICVLILSWSHATSLFTRSGYVGWLGQIGVIAFETTFVFSTAIAIWSSWIGEKVTGPTRFVLILGVMFNLYSNITSGIALDGKPIIFTTIQGVQIGEPVMIGAFIPTLFFAIERVIANAIFMYRKIKNQTDDHTIDRTVPDVRSDKVLTSNQTKTKQESDSKSDNESDKDLTLNQTKIRQGSDSDSDIKSDKNQTVILTDSDTKLDSNSDTESDKNQTDNQTVSDIKSDSFRTVDLTKIRQSRSTKSRATNRTKKTAKKSRSSKLSNPMEHTKKVALNYLEQHKTLPTIRELWNLAGTSKYYASEVIKEIKQEKKIS